MKIKETGSKFIGEHINYYSFCIDVNGGAIINIDELVNQAKHFSLITITGDEPFTQKDDIVKFIKKVAKENPDVKFRICTTGVIKPPQNIYGEIEYWIYIQLKSTNIPYNKRIIISTLEWYIQNKSNFVFDVNNEDDFDEVELIIANIGIPKSKVYLKSKNSFDNKYVSTFKNYCKMKGYNYIFNVE